MRHNLVFVCTDLSENTKRLSETFMTQLQFNIKAETLSCTCPFPYLCVCPRIVYIPKGEHMMLFNK